MVPPIKYKKRRQILPTPPSHSGRPPPPPPSSARVPSASLSSSSSVIPIPKTHIRRTPSELQLAVEVRRAEYDDVRMYARLVVGMQNQIQHDYRANGGVVHPLSKKSLQGVVRTKLTTYDEFDGEREDDGGDYDRDVDGRDVWRVSHDEDENDFVDSPWSTRAQWDQRLPPPKSRSDSSLPPRESTMLRGAEDYEEEDDFVFCLEL